MRECSRMVVERYPIPGQRRGVDSTRVFPAAGGKAGANANERRFEGWNAPAFRKGTRDYRPESWLGEGDEKPTRGKLGAFLSRPS